MTTIITDLDGTILVNGKLSDQTINVLREVQKRHRLVIATGRNIYKVKEICDILNMEEYATGCIIMGNGMFFYDFEDKEYIRTKSFSTLEIKFLISVCHLLLFRVKIIAGSKELAFTSLIDRIYSLYSYIFKGESLLRKTRASIMDNVEKLELTGTYCSSFLYKVLKTILFTYEVVRVDKWFIEVLPHKVNKFYQVKHIINKYNISANDLYVFGDSENDVKMLKYAVHSYAPKNAMDIARKSANFICDSCDNDGVVKIIKEKILDKK